MRIHVDTDLGGDTDDACALGMVLGWPDAEVVGVTTNLDMQGQRAGCAAHCLLLAGGADIPVAAGAEASLTTLKTYGSTWGDRRYWPDPVEPRPSAPGDTMDLLATSIASGATIVAIGAYTNLALLAVNRPGILDGVHVVVMGGWLDPPAEGLPQWGPDMDWNVQCDTRAAEILLATEADLTLATLPVTMQAQLRTAHLPRLRKAGALGRLLALQAQAHAAEHDMTALGRAHAGLADDLLNFQYDPVACAVALGWTGATVEQVRLDTTVTDGVLSFRRTPTGRIRNVLVGIEASAFADTWLDCIQGI